MWDNTSYLIVSTHRCLAIHPLHSFSRYIYFFDHFWSRVCLFIPCFTFPLPLFYNIAFFVCTHQFHWSLHPIYVITAPRTHDVVAGQTYDAISHRRSAALWDASHWVGRDHITSSRHKHRRTTAFWNASSGRKLERSRSFATQAPDVSWRCHITFSALSLFLFYFTPLFAQHSMDIECVDIQCPTWLICGRNAHLIRGTSGTWLQ